MSCSLLLGPILQPLDYACFSISLYGVSVSCIQVWYYFTHQHDQWPLKSIVAAVILFDTVHQALICHTVYTYLITHYGNAVELQQIVWSIFVEVFFNGFMAFLVQRLISCNGKIIVTAIVVLLVVAEFGEGCVNVMLLTVLKICSSMINIHTFVELATMKYLSISVNALAAAGDALITSTLCLLLHHSRTGFQKSDTMINQLILFAVNTGLLTSLCAIASLISILTAPNVFIYIMFFFCRIHIAAEGISSCSKISFLLKEIPKASGYSSHGPNISIKIDTTREFTSDVDHNIVQQTGGVQVALFLWLLNIST
ncbi:hypothetical protein EDD18DRAFT_1306038 [Armillaria luteobubalina]|uniref:DUF6534 domain-containing protein n=1 Tax=Armillaria luteobubalina TaxID=153913 RepID=A0AA39UV25_9AGAR|nr:hypothetical protein EDD18DRAFT_1306038 [Armillaria luteobubalina]